MAQFTTYNSWGRTRSPKNLAGAVGTAITLETNTNNMLGSASGYKTVGYATENQRFLHVLVTDANGSGAPGAITIFVTLLKDGLSLRAHRSFRTSLERKTPTMPLRHLL